jgi:glucan endo-1,3-beta-D-glucosidase
VPFFDLFGYETAHFSSPKDEDIKLTIPARTDGYPYYQNTEQNHISQAANLFKSAYDETTAIAKGKPIWITETGWPSSGPTENQAIASVANAQAYWKAVGCGILFGKINTWWFQLNDYPLYGAIAFGVTGNNISSNGIFDMKC